MVPMAPSRTRILSASSDCSREVRSFMRPGREKPQKKRPFSFRRNERFWRVSLAGFVFPHAWVVRRPQAELQIGANLILPSVQSRLFQEIAPVGRADLDLRGRTAARQRQRDVAAGGPAAPYAAEHP